MSARGVVHHPVFARLYDRFGAMAEKAGQHEHRRELLGGLAGRVVEVGAGNGLNFPHYPPEVEEVIAVEPEAYLRERAREAVSEAPVPVRVVDGLAERLPLADGSVDAAVVSLVLCSVASQAAALAEPGRVLRPGGELRFYETSVPRRRASRLQRAADVVWPHVAGSYHTHRDTPRAIERAGFAIETCRRFPFRPCSLFAPIEPHVLGRARRA